MANKLAEAESCTALLAVGLGPSFGGGSANFRGRSAAAPDLMETARGVVEEVFWRLVTERTFRKADFREDHAEQVWLRPPFSHQHADQLMPVLAARLAPVVEELAHRTVNGPLLADNRPERPHTTARP
jgi:CRISPR/Cas system-associated endonuclease Cas1